MLFQNSTCDISKFPCPLCYKGWAITESECIGQRMRNQSTHKNEIDLIVDKGDQMDIIEFKASETIKTQMFDGLSKFEEISQIKNLNKSLVYGGDTSQKRSAGNLVSWREFV